MIPYYSKWWDEWIRGKMEITKRKWTEYRIQPAAPQFEAQSPLRCEIVETDEDSGEERVVAIVSGYDIAEKVLKLLRGDK